MQETWSQRPVLKILNNSAFTEEAKQEVYDVVRNPSNGETSYMRRKGKEIIRAKKMDTEKRHKVIPPTTPDKDSIF